MEPILLKEADPVVNIPVLNDDQPLDQTKTILKLIEAESDCV